MADERNNSASVVHSPCDDHTERLEEHCPRAADILKETGLYTFFPNQLSINCVMRVGLESSSESTNISLNQIGLRFFKRLLMLDHTARDEYDNGVQHIKPCLKSNPTDFFDSWASIPDARSNPLDFFMLAFLCCDQRLKQMFIQKAVLCRLAIPIFYPKVLHEGFQLLKWPLRSLILDWKELADDRRIKFMTSNAFEADMHVISFCRLGSSTKFSKSELINSIIADDAYPSFTHKNCQENTTPVDICKGLIEGTWYLPSGEPSDVFKKLTLFLNVRGNVLNLDSKDHLRLLKGISTVMVLKLDASKLQQMTTESLSLISLASKVLIIFDKSDGIPRIPNFAKDVKDFQEKISENGAAQMFSTFLHTFSFKSETEIRKNLQIILNKQCEGASLTNFGKIRGFNTDECESDIQDNIKIAENVFSCFRNHHPGKVKELIPLQGTSWKKVTGLLKKNLNSIQGVEKGDEIQQAMDIIFDKAISPVNKVTLLMHEFSNRLSDCISSERRHVFLLHLKNLFDGHSRLELPHLVECYNSNVNTVHKLRESIVDQSGPELIEEILTEIEQTWAEHSFGIEHLFRELGLMYEFAVKSICSEGRSSVSMYPSIMANLIVDGYAFEMLDGDVKNIPLVWVKAVFKQLEEKVGNQKILVVSVIGVQSSGKSTLLNAMFGLQMPVSSGRCTKGVFMQLIHVEPEIKRPYKYVCVLDTEGLRSPGLNDEHEFDNELATFALGLADITLVNVKGENYTEVKDVIHIAVHAFLRMKVVTKKNSKCIFVHQNVPSVRAKVLLKSSGQKLQYSLDEMTKEAAQQEKLTLGYKEFSDVIEFNSETDVWFFPDLWHGNPPMSHISRSYFRNVAKLRENILTAFSPNRSEMLNLNDVSDRIETLWYAILSENFVFSFRNSLEIRVYLDLEQKHLSLVLEIGETFQILDQNANNQLEKCENLLELKACRDELSKRIDKQGDTVTQTILEKLDSFISDSSYAKASNKWREGKKRLLESEITESVLKSKNNLKKYFDDQHYKISTFIPQSKNITEQVLSFARIVSPERVNDKQWLVEEFQKMWDRSIPEQPQSNDINDSVSLVASQMKTSLIYRFRTKGISMLKEKCDLIGNREFRENFAQEQSQAPNVRRNLDRLVELSKNVDWNDYNVDECEIHRSVLEFSLPSDVNNELVISMVKSALQKAVSFLNDLENNPRPFSKSITEQLLQLALGSLEQSSVTVAGNQTIEFTSKYIFHLGVDVCKLALKPLCVMHLQYERSHGVRGALESQKKSLLNVFLNTCRNQSSEKVAIDIFKDSLETVLNTFVQEEAERFTRRKLMEMFSSKQKLILHVLDELVQKDDFNLYLSYLSNHHYYALRLFRFEGEDILCASAKQIIFQCIMVAKASIPKRRLANSDNVKFTDWITQFSDEFNQNILKLYEQSYRLAPHDFHIYERDFAIANLEISNHMFAEKATDTLDSLQLELESVSYKLQEKSECAKSPTDLLVGSHLIHSFDNMFDKIWGCSEMCPFCGEPCRFSDGQHVEQDIKHECIQHRPRGLRGITWSKTKSLVLETCNYAVASDLQFQFEEEEPTAYENYQQVYPDWTITQNSPSKDSKYWSRFTSKFIKELMKHFGAQETEVPQSWSNITATDAIESWKMWY